MKESVTDSNKALLDKSIINLYYKAVEASLYEDFECMKEFMRQYPLEYKRFSAVHRKRVVIRESISAMKTISDKIYFGTLTFNNAKNLNKLVCKRKEAFKKLNAEFEYVLLVEEYGEDNGRYHIHFLGVFRQDHCFDSFIRAWSHSRQNLRLLHEHENVSQYLCKYLVKDLPRVRRNKALVSLARAYHSAKSLQRYFPNVKEFSPKIKCNGVAFINAIDMI